MVDERCWFASDASLRHKTKVQTRYHVTLIPFFREFPPVDVSISEVGVLYNLSMYQVLAKGSQSLSRFLCRWRSYQ